MAKKKSFELFCFSCDADFTIKIDEENSKMEATYCPFCGEEIDKEDEVEIEEEDLDTEDEDRWD